MAQSRTKLVNLKWFPSIDRCKALGTSAQGQMVNDLFYPVNLLCPPLQDLNQQCRNGATSIYGKTISDSVYGNRVPSKTCPNPENLQQKCLRIGTSIQNQFINDQFYSSLTYRCPPLTNIDCKHHGTSVANSILKDSFWVSRGTEVYCPPPENLMDKCKVLENLDQKCQVLGTSVYGQVIQDSVYGSSVSKTCPNPENLPQKCLSGGASVANSILKDSFWTIRGTGTKELTKYLQI
eukprot:Pgem_evm1s4131